MSRGYSKSYSRKCGVQTSIQFDTLFNENSNRPSAVRSAGTVGKWGITSFTSIRTANGLGIHRDDLSQKRMRLDNDQNKSNDPFSFDNNTSTVPIKPKKFFKSRNPEPADTGVRSDAALCTQKTQVTTYTSNKKSKASRVQQPPPPLPPPSAAQKVAVPKTSPRLSASKKFEKFNSKNTTKLEAKIITVPALSPGRREDGKPPIVLRISKGKSRLLSDSDELTDHTPSPTIVSVGLTSPSAKSESNSSKSESNSSKSPAHGRVTRSTRRNQQLPDPDLSDSNDPFPSLFMSPRKSFDSEPQYIPAEEYELERKAIYDNLLGGGSPTYKVSSIIIKKDNSTNFQTYICNQTSESCLTISNIPGESNDNDNDNDNVSSNVKIDNKNSNTQNNNIECVGDGDGDSNNGNNTLVISRNSANSLTEVTKKIDKHQTCYTSSADNITSVDVVQHDNDNDNENEIEKESCETLEKSEELLASTQVDFTSAEKILNNIIPKKNSYRSSSSSFSSSSANNNNNNNNNSNDNNDVRQDWSSGSDSEDITNDLTVHEQDIAATTDVDIQTVQSIAKNDNTKQEEDKPPDDESQSQSQSQPPPPPVKLVISKKKGSIFKSRSLIGGSKKRHALYKHKWCDDKDPQKTPNSNIIDNSKTPNTESGVIEEMDFESAQLTRVTHWPGEDTDPMDETEAITSIKCTKKAKGFYTVVRNVKKAHQIQEIGEFQEFNDDVDYILDALQDNNPMSTRCLSAITLATKCMTPAFRMHVRAHGTVAKFFKALHDATKDQSLGLCTATVMFVLSQDRLNMDLDRDCLELMLNLLESDVSHKNALDACGLSSAQLQKNKQKVREICAEIQSQGHALHLNLDNITVGHLAMETLLSLTSKRAGEWFKEELRGLGGLDHIVKTICECCRQVSDYVVTWTDTLLDKLRKVDRCMRVLENVTHLNEENQVYILKYNNGAVLDTLVKLYRLCDAEIPLYPITDITDKESTGAVIREALLVTLKVLINLTHHYNSNSMGSALLGSKQGIVDASLHLLLQVPNYIPEQKKFELSVLVLMLLINLIQHCDENKKLLLDAKAPADFESIFPCDKSAVQALIEQFYVREQLARLAEQRTNAILDGEKDTETNTTQSKSQEEFIEETVHKLLQKAGTHMEHTMIASYIVLLIGYVIMDNSEYETRVRTMISTHNFTAMHDLLVKFFNFMKMTASGEAVSVCHIKATEKVIKYLEKCDKEMEEKSDEQDEQEINNLNMTIESSDRNTTDTTSELDLDMSLS